MAKFTLAAGRLQILGPEGWEPVGDVISAELAAGGEWVAVQTQVEHLCDGAEVSQLGQMRFCSGCGAWLEHPDAPR